MKTKYLVMACLIGLYAGQAQASALWMAATVDMLEEREAKEELAEQLKEVADIKQERARLEAIIANQAALIEAGLESSDGNHDWLAGDWLTGWTKVDILPPLSTSSSVGF